MSRTLQKNGVGTVLIELTKEQNGTLTATERDVISWLNEHEDLIPDRSISEIADESFTSPATVSRAIRKCGFSGIAEMKYKASAKMNYVVEEKIVNEIFNRTLMECQKTIHSMNVDTILRVIQHIKCSEKIYLLARGTTALIARDFEFQLQLLGYNAYLMSDSQIMKRSKKLFKKDDLIIIFTVKNSTRNWSCLPDMPKRMELSSSPVVVSQELLWSIIQICSCLAVRKITALLRLSTWIPGCLFTLSQEP